MNWTHSERARAHGWDLFDVHDGRRWRRMAMPLGFGPQAPHMPAFNELLKRMAQTRDAAALQAIKIMARDNMK